MLHAIKMMISMKKGTSNLSLIFLKICIIDLVEIKENPRESQQGLGEVTS
jgi:hypothetical protein